MPTEPLIKRAVAFIDGQNLYHAARESFGYTYPNFNVKSLFQRICQDKGWAKKMIASAKQIPSKLKNKYGLV